jgi:hypothetical protein
VNETALTPIAADRCNVCERRVAYRCKLCGGAPEPGVTLEQLARGVAQVDGAVRRYRNAA